jgi:hypothetical protein
MKKDHPQLPTLDQVVTRLNTQPWPAATPELVALIKAQGLPPPAPKPLTAADFAATPSLRAGLGG